MKQKRDNVPEIGCPSAPYWVNALLLEESTIVEFRVACGMYCMLERDGLWPTRTALYRRIHNYLPNGYTSMLEAFASLNNYVHAVFVIVDPDKARKPGPRAQRFGFSPYPARWGMEMNIETSTLMFPGRNLTDAERERMESVSANNKYLVEWLLPEARAAMDSLPDPVSPVGVMMRPARVPYSAVGHEELAPLEERIKDFETRTGGPVQSLGSLPRDDEAEIAAAHAEADTKFESPDMSDNDGMYPPRPDPEPDPTYEEPPF